MDFDEMITAVRDDALDVDTAAWTPARVGRQLNRAIQWCARLLVRHSRLNPLRATEDFTTSTATRAYTLTATAIMGNRLSRMYQIDSNSVKLADAMEIDSLVDIDPDQWAYDGFKWRYYLTRSLGTPATPTDGVFTVNFPTDPGSGLTFRCEYFSRPSDFTVGSGDSPTYIPVEYHDLIVARTVMRLVGPDGSHFSDAVLTFQTLLTEAKQDMGRLADPSEIRMEGVQW
jgi:hypothetical protein